MYATRQSSKRSILAVSFLLAVFALLLLLADRGASAQALASGSPKAVENAAGLSQSQPQSTGTPCGPGGWSVVPAPDGGSYSNALYGVASISPNDVWAVGEQYESAYSSYVPLVEHWNGSAWSVVQSSQYGVTLRGVTAISANDVWAVGWMGGYSTQPLTEHWDGSQWTYVQASISGARKLYGVAAISTNDVWAVGQSGSQGVNGILIIHWNGTQWSSSPTPTIANGVLYGVTAISANDSWAVGTSNNGETVTLHWDGTQWSRIGSPNSGSYINVLTSASATASNDIWAVGYWATSGVEYHGYTMHWDGSQWSAIDNPTNPSGPDDPTPAGTYLYGVSTGSNGEAWAVGRNLQNSGTTGITLHLQGGIWTIVPSPNPGYANTRLYAVSAPGPDSIWAVGNFDTSSLGYTYPLTEHYSGSCLTQTPAPTSAATRTAVRTNTPAATRTRPPTGTPGPCQTEGSWTTVPAPDDGSYSNALYGVASISPNDTWAVGEQYSSSLSSYIAIIEHWNGSAWSVVPGSPYSLNLRGITAISADDVWAVGWMGGYGFSPFTEHWDGSQWSYVQSPVSGGRRLYGVSAASTNDVWAVGLSSSQGVTGTLIIHWNGTQWNPSPSPSIANGVLYGVSAISANDSWAVGTSNNGETVTLHWNGTQWSRIASPNSGAYINVLTSVSAIGSSDVWAVGYWATSGVEYHGYTMHWDGTQWSAIDNPTNPYGLDDPTPAGIYLYGVSTSPSGEAWAVGRNLQNSGTTGITLHLQGGIWTIMPSPNPGYANTRLYAVSVPGPVGTWAVGTMDTNSLGYTVPLTEQYNNLCPTQTPGTPSPTSTPRPPTSTPTRPTATNTSPPTGTSTPVPTVCGPNSNYIISQSVGATIVPGTTDSGLHCSECSTTIDLPFPFTLYDRIFTSAIVTSKGTLGFVGVTEAYWSDCLPDQYSNYAIFPHWDDLDVSSTCGSGNCGIYTSVSGQAPSRIFNIEWRARYHNLWNTANFEVRLYEGQNRFDLVYGDVTLQGYNATVGVQRDTGSLYAEFSCWGYVLPQGLQLAFTMPVCDNTPTVLPSNTPTALATGTHIAHTATPVQSTATLTATHAPLTATPGQATATATSCSIQFSDVPADSAFYRPIACLTCRNVMSGYPDGTFKPGANVTRGQLAKIVANAARFNETVNGQTFEDIQPGSTFYLYVERMAARGIISGYQCGGPGESCGAGNRPYYRQGSNATREQISKIVAMSASLGGPAGEEMFEDVPVQSAFYNWIEPLGEHGMMSGYPCGAPTEPCGSGHKPYFRPSNNATRGQTSKIVANTFFPNCQTPTGPNRPGH
jgi:hypothetical protein